MKGLITTNDGGLPLYSTSIQYIQDNVKELTSILAKSFSYSNVAYILNGCTFFVSGSGGATPKLITNPGAIWFNDEIYFVDLNTNEALPPYTTTSEVQNNYMWDIIVTESEPETYKDLTSKNTFYTRKMKLVKTGVIVSGLKNLPTLVSLLDARYIQANPPYATETTEGLIRLATNTDVINNTGTNEAVTTSGLRSHGVEGPNVLSVNTQYFYANTGGFISESNLRLEKLNNGMFFLHGIVATKSITDAGQLRLLTNAYKIDGTFTNNSCGFGINSVTGNVYSVYHNGYDGVIYLSRAISTGTIESNASIRISIYF